MKQVILFILNSDSFSGAENIVISIIEGIRDNYNCIYMARKGRISKVLETHNIDSLLVEKINVYTIFKAINRFRPDIIYANDFTASFFATVTLTRIPIINHLHSNPPWIKWKNRNSYAYCLAAIKSKSIIAVSDSIMEEYIFGKYFFDKTKVLGNPIKIQNVLERAQSYPCKDQFDIAFFGRLSEAKNPLLFVDIINALRNRMPNIRAIMVGDGELRSQVEEKVKSMKLTNNVILGGFQSEPYGLISASKLVCMPSVWEGFGLTAVEALALGKPVFSTPVGGLIEIVNETCGGFCESAEQFVDKIYELLTNSLLYKTKSYNAIVQSKKFDNYDQYINSIKGILESVSGQ